MDFKSKRTDGAGHWPKGKRRHEPTEADIVFMRGIREYCNITPGARKEIAADLNVSLSTVYGWTKGHYIPSAVNLHFLRRWLNKKENARG